MNAGKHIAPLVSLCLATAPCDAEVTPIESYAAEAKALAEVLSNRHYRPRTIDDDLSREWLRRYLERLDPLHRWFTHETVTGLERRFGTALDDALAAGDMAPAREIYHSMRANVELRRAWIRTFLSDVEPGRFDFTGGATTQARDAPRSWPPDAITADKRWREDLLAEVLAEKLSTDAPVAVARDRVAKRYERLCDRIAEEEAEAIFALFMKSLVECYDSHCDYFSVSDLDRFRGSGRIAGVGALLKITDDGYCTIVGILAGGPAEQAGLHIGDRIIAVAQGKGGEGTEFVDAIDHSLDGVVEEIRGWRDTPVTLKIIPTASPDPALVRQVTIRRGHVPLHLRLAQASVVEANEDGGTYGLLKLRSFYRGFGDGDQESATRDLIRLITRLKGEAISGMILDLRGNGGGSFQEALGVASLFVGDKTIAQLRRRVENGELKTEAHRGTREEPLYRGPLVVLVDSQTASVAEAVAGALQDHGRATVVGTPTFGKGTIQTIAPLAQLLPDETVRAGALKYTESAFYRPSGASIQVGAIRPDVRLQADPVAPPRITENQLPNPLPHDQIAASPDFVRRTPSLPRDFDSARQQSSVAIKTLLDQRTLATLSLDEDKRRINLARISTSLEELERETPRDPPEVRAYLTLHSDNRIRVESPVANAKPPSARDAELLNAAIEILHRSKR